MSIDTMIGVDLAKSVFQVHGASMNGEIQFQRKLSRQTSRTFMARHPAAAVVMEACGSAHYWARVLSGFGHEVRLIAPRFVRPFVKRQTCSEERRLGKRVDRKGTTRVSTIN